MLRYARFAVTWVFTMTGIVFSTWSIHIPTVQDHLKLSEGTLGTVLLTMAIGSIGVMPFVGGLIGRFSSKQITLLTGLGMVVGVPILLMIGSIWLLVPLLILFGIFNGAIDIAVNTQAVTIERRARKPMMSSFHAGFSIGGLIGALLGSLLLKFGVTPLTHVSAVSGLMVATLIVAQRFLVADDPPAATASQTPTFVLPHGILLPLGLIALVDLIAEGAIIDWSAVYLRNWLGASPALAGLGFAAYSLTMSIGRLSGDWFIARFGRRPLLRTAAWIATVGLLIGILVPHPAAAIFGFACVGLGLANVIPILFNAAGQVPGISSGTALAAVTTTGYTGFFIGPPLIGWTAEAFNLPIAMGLVVVCCAIVAIWSPRILTAITSNEAASQNIPTVVEQSS